MRKPLPAKLEACRVTNILYSEPSWGGYGMFIIRGPNGPLKIIASAGDLEGDDTGWEHASITRIPSRLPPNWAEMCFVKDLFWDDEECVVQFHPPKSMYVSNHPTCLHLFRPVDGIVRMPPPEMVGLKDEGENVTKERATELHRKWVEQL